MNAGPLPMKYSKVGMYAKFHSQRELMMVIVIIGIVAALMLPFYANAVFKATLIEPINLMQPLKWEVVERLALTGTWEDMAAGEPLKADANAPGQRAAARKRIASARDLEETHAGLARTDAAAADIEGLGARRQSSSNAIVGLSNGIPTAVVASSFVPTPSIVEWRPLVNPASPAVVNWLCGRQLAFAGVATVPPREPAVPTELLPISCRVRL